MTLRRIPFRTLYLIGFGCVAISLSNLRLFMSIGQFIVLGTWLLEGFVHRNLTQKFKAFFQDRAALAFSAIFFLHLLGLIYTTNMEWGQDLVRILLPFLLLPVIAAGIPRFSQKEFSILVSLFVLGTVLTSFYGFYTHYGAASELASFRDYSPLISHIRMALMVAMSFFFLIWYFGYMDWALRVIAVLLIAWCWYYLNLMRSIQGMAIVVLGSAVLLIARSSRFKPFWRTTIRTIALSIPLAALFYSSFCIWQYYNVDPNILQDLETHTSRGDVYYHNLEDPMVENGHYVWINIAWTELMNSWEDRSDLALNDLDRKGQPLTSTLIRYMSSKGLKKDADGMAEMSELDIANVEAGVANIKMFSGSGLRQRVDQVIFEIDRYRAKRDPDGNSLAMRFEFWRASLGLIEKNFVIGVGTGDTPEAFAQQYLEMGSPLAKAHRYRAHNEYLTIFISFGLIGVVIFLFALFYPLFNRRVLRHGLVAAFIITMLVSFLTDDTLERQAGATFVAFFYTILVFLSPDQAKP